MKFDLIRPCDHCPFRRDEGRITLRGRERAEEIEETAYRQGFPCHEHAEHVEEEDDPMGGGGYYATEDSQHCFGALWMYIRDGGSNLPWEEFTANEENETKFWKRLTREQIAHADKVVFESDEDFLDANDTLRD